jgi:tRNA-2-methylthio-N6-dimethylallyladenosine synthase
LLEIQDNISRELNNRFIGKTVEIFVDGISKPLGDKGGQLSGRTWCDRIVVFESPDDRLVGQFLKLNIYAAAPFTLFATIPNP